MLKAGGIYWPWKTLSSHLNHNICSLVYLFQLRPIVFDDWLIPSSYLHISPSFLKIKDRDHFEDSKVPSNVTSCKIPFILMSDKWDIYDYADLLRCFRGYVLCAVSLLTLVAIGIDRLLALLLGLRYGQVITSRRTCMTLIVWWIFSRHRRHFNLLLRSSCKVVVRRCNLTSLSNYLIFVLCSFFLILRHNQIKVQDHLSQRQQNQSISLNIARYRKAVTGALWVHTALVVSYLSSLITAVVGTRTGYAIIGLPC